MQALCVRTQTTALSRCDLAPARISFSCLTIPGRQGRKEQNMQVALIYGSRYRFGILGAVTSIPDSSVERLAVPGGVDLLLERFGPAVASELLSCSSGGGARTGQSSGGRRSPRWTTSSSC